MPEPGQPTPYADVNAVLHTFLAQVQTILGLHFVGMYLVGSLAVGDFDPASSDIDFVILTDATLPAAFFTALADMHARFAAGDSLWAARVEAVYIPQPVLRGTAPAGTQFPQIEKGRPLFMDQPEPGWSVQCYTLREHGVVLAGPDPHTLVDPVDPDDVRRAGAAIAATWIAQAQADPTWLVWMRVRENQAFVVLTLCRLLWTREFGTVTSKPAAARWAQQSLGQRSSELIARSLAGQHDHRATPASDAHETLALLAYAGERLQPA